MIAIIIASTSLVIILQGLGSSLRGSNIAKNYFRTSLLAESQMAMLEKEIGVKPESSSGKFSKDKDPDGIFSWSQYIKQIRPVGIGGTIDIPVCEVQLMVDWKERSGQRGVTLVTYLPKYEESPAER